MTGRGLVLESRTGTFGGGKQFTTPFFLPSDPPCNRFNLNKLNVPDSPGLEELGIDVYGTFLPLSNPSITTRYDLIIVFRSTDSQGRLRVLCVKATESVHYPLSRPLLQPAVPLRDPLKLF